MVSRANTYDKKGEEPRSLASFLGTYTKKLPVSKKLLVEFLNSYVGGTTIKDVDVRNGILTVRAPASVKQKLFIEKKKLLSEINNSILKLTLRDIK